MEFGVALDLGRNAFFLALKTAAPVLLAGMIVGLFISLVQAITQLQEQTLTFVPKIVAMVLAASYFIPWIATRMVEYAQDMFGTLPA
jgi:flagellar biosynthetic protein FliQ